MLLCALVRPQVSPSTLPSSASCMRAFTNFAADRPSPSSQFTESKLSVGESSNSIGVVDPRSSLTWVRLVEAMGPQPRLSSAAQTGSWNSSPLLIAALPPSFGISTTCLPPGMVGDTYSEALAASEGNPPYTWKLTKGSKWPAGLKLGKPTGIRCEDRATMVSDASIVEMGADCRGRYRG
jgi:hypothetical protein